MAINNNKIVAVATAITNKITSLISAHDSSNSAHSSLFNNKVDKDGSKVLSTNDYTTAEKDKLAGIANGATNVSVDSALSSSSTNPVQNKKVKEALDDKVDKVSGKQLSTNDFTNAYKEKLDGIDEQLGSINMSWDALTGKPETFTPSAHTHGLLQNDGKITNVSSPGFDASAKPLVRDASGNLNITTFLTSWLVHNSALPNLGLQTGSTKNQKDLNEAIDTALGNKISKSQTVGLVKNDGSIDTNTYLTQHQDISGKASQADLTALTSRVSALETSEFQIVFKSSKSQLPAVGRANTLYYIANTDSNNENTYDEYTWISSDSRYELLGPRTIDLSDYVLESELVTVLDGIVQELNATS